VRVAWRKDLEQLLAAFVAEHRGLRSGRMFGWPGAFAGSKLFACVAADGIAAKLPAAAHEAALAQGARRWTRNGRPLREWLIFRPATPRQAAALATFLEIAARHVAERVTSLPAQRVR
jgi:hypothetical protein